MDCALIDFNPFTTDFLFDHDLDLSEIQAPAYMCLDTPSDMLEVTPTTADEISTTTSNNTEDPSTSGSNNQDDTEEITDPEAANRQLLLWSQSFNLKFPSNAGDAGPVQSLEENNGLNEQSLTWDEFLVYPASEPDSSLPTPTPTPETSVETNNDRTPTPTNDTVEGPPRKRTRVRRRQIIPAEISYSQLAGAAPTRVSPRSPAPTQVQQISSVADHHTSISPLLPTTAASENPCGQTFQPLLPQFCGQTMSVPFVPQGTNVVYETVSIPNVAGMASGSRFISSTAAREEMAFPWQSQTQTTPYLTPVETLGNRPFTSRPSHQARQFTFAENTVPNNFVPNPNNHGRWLVDELGRRQYLNAPRNKRTRLEAT